MGKSQLKVGERALSFILILFSIFAIYQSYKISGKQFTSSCPGAFPMFTSIVLLILGIWIWGEKKHLSPEKYPSLKEKMRAIRDLILNRDIFIVIILIFAYSMVLEILGFSISTFLFLWISMTYLSLGKIIRNFGISLLSLSIILLIFKTIFRVILP